MTEQEITIKEAIETLEDYLRDCFPTATSKHAKAVKLGIEGLKEIQYLRSHHHFRYLAQLPGETME